MRVTKKQLFAVLHVRGRDDQPLLAQRLPAVFDTDDYPGLLDQLGLSPEDLTGPSEAEAEELSELDADPHGRLKDAWRYEETRQRRAELVDDLAEEADELNEPA